MLDSLDIQPSSLLAFDNTENTSFDHFAAFELPAILNYNVDIPRILDELKLDEQELYRIWFKLDYCNIGRTLNLITKLRTCISIKAEKDRLQAEMQSVLGDLLK